MMCGRISTADLSATTLSDYFRLMQMAPVEPRYNIAPSLPVPAIREQRCIVPVSGFYEWRKEGEKKQPYYIQRVDHQPLALAGLWESWSDPEGGEVVESCSLVTMAAVAPMLQIHHRMPAVMEPEHFALWLDPAVNEPHLLEDVLKAEEHVLEICPVSTFVNNAGHEGDKCVEPLT